MPTHHIVALRGDTEASLDPATELSCSACGSLAFRYSRVLDDDKPVICAVCGAFISTYGEMLAQACLAPGAGVYAYGKSEKRTTIVSKRGGVSPSSNFCAHP
jgi:hypothetical protein